LEDLQNPNSSTSFSGYVRGRAVPIQLFADYTNTESSRLLKQSIPIMSSIFRLFVKSVYSFQKHRPTIAMHTRDLLPALAVM